MLRYVFCILALLISTGAQAHKYHHHQVRGAHVEHNHRTVHHGHYRHYAGHYRATSHDGRPSAWCGWFGRFNFLGHDPGPAFNLAANWRSVGTPDASPHNGDIVVWPHHVGKIVGQCNGYMCPVWSGNDGHAVRARVRNVAGASYRRIG